MKKSEELALILAAAMVEEEKQNRPIVLQNTHVIEEVNGGLFREAYKGEGGHRIYGERYVDYIPTSPIISKKQRKARKKKRRLANQARNASRK
jgi:hypothetical protein